MYIVCQLCQITDYYHWLIDINLADWFTDWLVLYMHQIIDFTCFSRHFSKDTKPRLSSPNTTLCITITRDGHLLHHGQLPLTRAFHVLGTEYKIFETTTKRNRTTLFNGFEKSWFSIFLCLIWKSRGQESSMYCSVLNWIIYDDKTLHVQYMCYMRIRSYMLLTI